MQIRLDEIVFRLFLYLCYISVSYDCVNRITAVRNGVYRIQETYKYWIFEILFHEKNFKLKFKKLEVFIQVRRGRGKMISRACPPIYDLTALSRFDRNFFAEKMFQCRRRKYDRTRSNNNIRIYIYIFMGWLPCRENGKTA